ncbi:MAG: glutamine--fructose-6-phosphate transaminase (isomerizing) [Acidobacteria bacterium]|nr:glutamine--fructose-6-phosphate transaminase (isomerizing) [Acidobacteriota bacterium]
MCGILCYLGKRPALPILLEGLRKLEYRGYDSSGVAIMEGGEVFCQKAVGKIQALEANLAGVTWQGSGGIAHTRWATHGRPSVENAHPQKDCREKIFIIHNGIIENHQSLKKQLLSLGHRFCSDTDTEVLAHLIEEHYQGDLEEAVKAALRLVEGAYGIGVICVDHPEEIVVARKGSPLILGIGEEEVFAASDVSALVSHTKEVIYLQDNDVAVLHASGYNISNLNYDSILRHTQKVEWDVEAAEKQGFPHFMLKEIYEQPEAVENAMRGRLIEQEGISKLGGLDGVHDEFLGMERLMIVSMGTSYYAALLGRYIIETCTDIPVEVDLASEFRYRKLNIREGTAVLAISQSGETADTLAAVQEAQRKGALVLGMVNVVGSSIARETDAGVYNHAGPEIGVASTKAFLSQLTILYLITLALARHQRMSLSEGQAFIAELKLIPDKIRRILDSASQIEAIARRYHGYKSFLYLGRKFNYPIALEGALKLKEISYIHAEGYAAGEMKHGPIALIDENFPSVCLAPRDSAYEKMVSNIQEVKARNGRVIAVGTEGDTDLQEICDEFIEVPATDEILLPLLMVVPLQLLAYYIARENGCEIDQPRNLAKAVTVE